MTLEHAYYVAGIVAAVGAMLGLVGLFYYACETTRLRRTAEKQLEAMVKPCVIFAEQENASVDSPLKIRNVGAGPALNIRWKTKNGASWSEDAVLAAGESRTSAITITTITKGGQLVSCVYESLSQKRYQTDTGFSEQTQDLQPRHIFKEL